jgi:hypothetical protein
VAITYPSTTRGFRRRTRSDQTPDPIFVSDAVDSATPSIRPIAAGPAPSVFVKKPGRSG